jgi:hypothetical protein
VIELIEMLNQQMDRHRVAKLADKVAWVSSHERSMTTSVSTRSANCALSLRNASLVARWGWPAGFWFREIQPG